jgi:hypothetical protein
VPEIATQPFRAGASRQACRLSGDDLFPAFRSPQRLGAVGTWEKVCLYSQKLAKKTLKPGPSGLRGWQSRSCSSLEALAMTKEGEISDSLAQAGEELVETAGTYFGAGDELIETAGTYFGGTWFGTP